MLRRERAAMKKAVRRLATVERWASEHPGEVDEKLLSLGWHLDQIAVERAMKAKERKKVTPKLTARARTVKEFPPVKVGVREPPTFPSVP